MIRPRFAATLAACLFAVILVPIGARAEATPLTVIALIDSGVNPYHPAFRDDSPLAQQHPSTYLPGYPVNTWPLELTLDAPSLPEALAADAAVWASVRPGTLYYVPGTRIVGMISFGPGGVYCDNGMPDVPPANGTLHGMGCAERLLLDDHGHGTMTASRAAGAGSSLSPSSRIVSIEGLGSQGVSWAAARPWIDVQSNSWGSLAPGYAYRQSIEQAATKHLVVFASGNGLGFSGVAPTPTQTHATRGLGAIQVGAHDNGYVEAWSDAPAHLVADGYGGLAAPHDSLAPVGPRPIACCTSAAAPYATGAAAGILADARTLLGDTSPGMTAGSPPIAASGTPVAGSPMLSDGIFDLTEWRTLVLRSAEARPSAGMHDGLLHPFATGPAAPDTVYGPGANPFCLFCFPLPIRWADVPANIPAYVSIGYGAANERSVALAARVLRGEVPLPARDDVDAFFAIDDQLGTAHP